MGRHALIIEDEILIALEVQDVLETMGFQTFDLADNPNEALARAKARRPDLITADLRIVGGTGLEAVQAITAALGPVPVVYVTANADLLKGQGALAVVEKPIAWPEFTAACDRVCDRAA